MDFATLKAYMTSLSIKENLNNTIVCGQKRLTVSKVERQTNRTIRLTQFRKIPENMSPFNTPQTIRTAAPINITKPAVNNTSKLYEEKRNMRMQRLQEFKEKKEKFKREEAAKKKPMFKVTHASLEKYDLKNTYGNIKGIPVANLLPSKEPYIFSAPKNVQAIHFLRKTPVKAMESPKRRVTRSTTRLQTDKLNEVKNKSTLNKIAERVTTAPKMVRVAKKSTSIDDKSKNLSQRTKTPIKSKKPNNNQRLTSNSSSDDNNDVTLNKFVKAPSKLRSKTTKSEEMPNNSNYCLTLPGTSKSVTINATKADSMLTSTNSPSDKPKERKVVIKTPVRRATVRITKVDQILADTSASYYNKNKESNIQAVLDINKESKSSLITPSKVKPNKSPEKLKKPSKNTPLKLNTKSENVLSKTGSEGGINLENAPKTPRSARKSKLEEVVINSPSTPKTLMKKSPKIKINKSIINSKTNQVNPKCTPSSRCLRSQSTDIHNEEKDLIDNSMQSKKIKNRTSRHVEKTPSKLNIDFQPDLPDILSERTTKKSVSKTPTKAIQPKESENLSVVVNNTINIENNINHANTTEAASFIKTPENNGRLPNIVEKTDAFKTPTGDGDSGINCIYISPFVTVSRGKQRAREEYSYRKSTGGTINSPALQESTNVKTAAEFFTLLLDKETKKINNNCDFWNDFKAANTLPEEAIDMIDVATGQGTLLKNKKMQTFRNLIQYSLEEQTDKPVTCMDLHGYWDVLNMQIDNVSTRFENLQKLRDNNWKEILPERPKRAAVVVAKKVSKPSQKKRSNALRDAIRNARLKSKAPSSESSAEDVKTPPPDRKSMRNSTSSAKGSQKRVSGFNPTPRKSISSIRGDSPHILMQVSQVAKSVDRQGSDAAQSAKSILKKRQSFKELGKKPKVVLFDVSDDVFEDNISTAKHIDSPFTRRSTRLH